LPADDVLFGTFSSVPTTAVRETSARGSCPRVAGKETPQFGTAPIERKAEQIGFNGAPRFSADRSPADTAPPARVAFSLTGLRI
jgi:hypothetical protein